MWNLSLSEIDHYTSIGPWLFDEESLFEMDDLISNAIKEVELYEANEAVKTNCSVPVVASRTLSIKTKSGIEKVGTNFRDLVIENQEMKDIPISFNYQIRVKYNYLTISLDRNKKKIDYIETFGSIENGSVGKKIKYIVDKYLEKYKPSLVKQIVRSFGFLSMLVLSLIIFLKLSYYDTIYNIEQNKPVVDEVKLLISKVTLTDIEIQRLLQLNTMKVFSIKTTDCNILSDENIIRDILLTIILGGIICILLIVNPKSTLAIGKGKDKVIFWNRYYRIIYYAIPVLILLPILINYISQNIF